VGCKEAQELRGECGEGAWMRGQMVGRGMMAPVPSALLARVRMTEAGRALAAQEPRILMTMTEVGRALVAPMPMTETMTSASSCS